MQRDGRNYWGLHHGLVQLPSFTAQWDTPLSGTNGFFSQSGQLGAEKLVHPYQLIIDSID
jgi:hypothetical protein